MKWLIEQIRVAIQALCILIIIVGACWMTWRITHDEYERQLKTTEEKYKSQLRGLAKRWYKHRTKKIKGETP